MTTPITIQDLLKSASEESQITQAPSFATGLLGGFKSGGLPESVPEPLDFIEQARANTLFEEGFKPKIFDDTKGKRTIGFGFNIDDPTVAKLLPVEVLNGAREITRQEALPIFNTLFDRAVKDAKSFLGEDIFDALNDDQKIAVTDMAFNLGLTRLGGFKGFRSAVQGGDFNRAGDEIKFRNPGVSEELTPFFTQVTNRANRNIKRIRGDQDG